MVEEPIDSFQRLASDRRPVPLRIVEASPPPTAAPGVERLAVSPIMGSYDGRFETPTQVLPIGGHVFVDASPAMMPVAPVPLVDDRRSAWPYFAVVLALIAGAVVGFLAGRSSHTENAPAGAASTAPTSTAVDSQRQINATLDSLLAQTKSAGQYAAPSQYPQLDEIVRLSSDAATKDLHNQVALLTAAQQQAAGLSDQVKMLQAALTAAQSQRDALSAQINTTNGTTGALQQQLDAATARATALQSSLQNASDQLATANKTVATTQASLATVQHQLDTASATLAALNPKPLPTYTNGDVGRARSDAAANGWKLIEQPTTSPTATPGTVLEQTPAPNTTVISGSVIYLKVAQQG